MRVTGRRVRFTAVLAGVVFALTGFSSSGGSGSGSSGKSKSGGGGCSSSKSKPKKKGLDGGGNGGNSGNGGGSGGSTATPAPGPSALTAHVELIACAGPGRPNATIKITSDAAASHNVRTTLTFEWEDYGSELQTIDVMALKPGESRTLDVPMNRAEKADGVKRCALGAVEVVRTSTPGPTTTTGSGSSGSSGDLPDLGSAVNRGFWTRMTALSQVTGFRSGGTAGIA